MNLILGVTGSLATLDSGEIVEQLMGVGTKRTTKQPNIEIKVVSTKNAKHFLAWNPIALSSVRRYDSDGDWRAERWGSAFGTNRQANKNVPLHVELAEWADAFLVAPITANTLAKFSGGYCDDLLSNIARVWNFKKPMLLAPAMNQGMFDHPVTNEHIERLVKWGATIVMPSETGEFGMASVETILAALSETTRKVSDGVV